MGGEVGVESDPGKGSVFWFTARLGIASDRSPVYAPAADIRGRRVLVADDNDVARTVIMGMLQAMGLHVAGVSSGYDAIAAVERAVEAGKPVEVVFVDCRMPELDGLQTVRRIQSLALGQPPAIVMMTAYGRDEMALELREAGAQEVLIKPVGQSVLFTTTVKALGFRHAIVAPPPRSASEPKVTGTSGRVLLVEDNEVNQMVVSMMLSNAGQAVDIAADGSIAVEMVQAHAYDLVLMDMQMPVMDGVQATIEIRKLPGMQSLPIVALTANVMNSDRQRCMDAGMNDFLTKPIDIRQLHGVLQRWTRHTPQLQAAGK